jgi:hypothetical protein
LADGQHIVYGFIHGLKVLHIVEFYQESQALMLMQVTERRLPGQAKAEGECMNARRKKRNLVLAHNTYYLFRSKFTLLFSNKMVL